MLRMILGVIAGFISWMILWIGSEKIIGVLWPAFGSHQKAFEDAIKNGGAFTPDTDALVVHIVVGSIVSLLAGSIAAFAAGENAKAPLIAGVLLLLMGIAKAAMSWQLVPMWYHILFTAMLLPMAFLGGRLIGSN